MLNRMQKDTEIMKEIENDTEIKSPLQGTNSRLTCSKEGEAALKFVRRRSGSLRGGEVGALTGLSMKAADLLFSRAGSVYSLENQPPPGGMPGAISYIYGPHLNLAVGPRSASRGVSLGDRNSLIHTTSPGYV